MREAIKDNRQRAAWDRLGSQSGGVAGGAAGFTGLGDMAAGKGGALPSATAGNGGATTATPPAAVGGPGTPGFGTRRVRPASQPDDRPRAHLGAEPGGAEPADGLRAPPALPRGPARPADRVPQGGDAPGRPAAHQHAKEYYHESDAVCEGDPAQWLAALLAHPESSIATRSPDPPEPAATAGS